MDTKKNGRVLLIVCVAVLVTVFAVGLGVVLLTRHSSSADVSSTTAVTDTSPTLKDGSPNPESPEAAQKAHGESGQVLTGEDVTKNAKIKDADAIEAIRAFSDEELGIKKEDYTMMVAGQAYVIDGVKYVQVIAAVKSENKDGTFSIDPKAKFYISFDGKHILKENMQKQGTYDTLK